MANAEIIDLEAYRQRRAAVARSGRASQTFSTQAWVVAVPFLVPVMVFAYWPVWLMASNILAVHGEGGHGSA